jgi:peptidoglycan/LPS O-acetylase OafA/YrhL
VAPENTFRPFGLRGKKQVALNTPVRTVDPPASIPGLTGIRGYAALWVVVSHLSFTDFLLFPLGMRARWERGMGLVTHEYLAVDVFFMLSGFVLAHVHGNEFNRGIARPEYARFLLLRLARIYPMHLLGLGLAAIAVHFIPDPAGGNHAQGLILQLLLMGSWGLGPRFSFNLPSWSLCSEWFAYLLFPLVALTAGALRTTRARVVGLAVIIGAFYVFMFRQPFPPLDYYNGFGAQTRVMTGVCLGVVLRGLYEDERLRRLPWTWILYASLPIAAFSMSELSGVRRPNNMGAYVMMIVILLAAALGKGRLMLPLTGRFPRYVGEISFGIYILHYPVLRTLRVLFQDRLAALAASGTELQVWATLIGSIVVVMLVAAAAHHLVEDPFRRWAKRRITAYTTRPRAS